VCVCGFVWHMNDWNLYYCQPNYIMHFVICMKIFIDKMHDVIWLTVIQIPVVRMSRKTTHTHTHTHTIYIYIYICVCVYYLYKCWIFNTFFSLLGSYTCYTVNCTQIRSDYLINIHGSAITTIIELRIRNRISYYLLYPAHAQPLLNPYFTPN